MEKKLLLDSKRLKAIDRIKSYTQDITSEHEFVGNIMIFDAVLRNLILIGEAAGVIKNHEKLLNKETKSITHKYYTMEDEYYVTTLWKVVQKLITKVQSYGLFE